MTTIYKTKSEAFSAAVNWVREGILGSAGVWREVPTQRYKTPDHPYSYGFAYLTDQIGKKEYYKVLGGDAVLGSLSVEASKDGLGGLVDARRDLTHPAVVPRDNPTERERTFFWRDEAEYVQQKRAKKTKAASERQAEKNGVGPSAQPNLFGKVRSGGKKRVAKQQRQGR